MPLEHIQFGLEALILRAQRMETYKFEVTDDTTFSRKWWLPAAVWSLFDRQLPFIVHAAQQAYN